MRCVALEWSAFRSFNLSSYVAFSFITLSPIAQTAELPVSIPAEIPRSGTSDVETQNEKIDTILENELMYFGDTTVTDLLTRFPGEEVATHLIDVIDDPTRDAWVRQKALAWLSRTGDKRVEEKLREYIDSCIGVGVSDRSLSKADFMLLHAATMGLGFTRTESALDYVWEIAQHEFWEQKNVTVPPMNWSTERLERHIRHAALWGLAKSGTERGVQLFGSGKNPMPDILSAKEFVQLSKRSKLFQKGIFTDPDQDDTQAKDRNGGN